MVEVEGLINAKFYDGPLNDGLPFSMVHIVGLTIEGHRFIRELSKDHDEIVEELREIRSTLVRLEPGKKQMGEKVIDELIQFIQTLTYAELQDFLGTLSQVLPDVTN